MCFPHTIRLSQTANSPDCSRNRWKDPSGQIVHTPLNPRRRPLGRRHTQHERTAIPGQTIRPNDGPGTAVSGQRPVVSQKTAIAPANTKTHLSRAHAPRDAPEPDSQYKRTTPPNRTAQTAWPHTQGALPRHMIKPNSGHSAIRTNGSFEASLRGHGGFIVCMQTHCGGDDRDRTDDPLLAKQVLSQLSYAPMPVVGGQASVGRRTKPRLATGR
jgi:hypothetical protein